jgi:hypothetical protein
MTIKDAWDNYYFHTGTASDIVRQLAYVGFAIIWFFARSTTPMAKIPDGLRLTTILLLIVILLDLFQYVTTATLWGIYTRSREKRNMKDPFDAPPSLNVAGIMMFYAKFVVILAAYVFLLFFLADRLLHA